MDNKKRNSKEHTLAHMLRHQPEKYSIVLDENGYAKISDVAKSLSLKEEEVKEIAEFSEKNRFEIADNKIRARYGHSFEMKITHEDVIPPDILYHGTSHQVLGLIMKEGIKPMKRQYVHLSKDIYTAVQVGKRKDADPVILVIDAKRAYNDGIRFYLGNEKTILADEIPNEYIVFYEGDI